MHLPIALGLAWPNRLADVSPRIDWTRAHTWEFFPLDDERFPAVALAQAAGRAGGTHPAVFNAANEAAVTAFTDGRLAFTGIVPAIETALSAHSGISDSAVTLEAVLDADSWAREFVARSV
jgi:1-deoxy-D-xylulose-5-phosphate reductoisomerase